MPVKQITKSLIPFLALIAVAALCLQWAPQKTTNPFLKLGVDRLRYPLHRTSDFLTFQELQRLYKNPEAKGLLSRKLKKFWTTPIISNEAYYQGARPRPLKDPRLGPYLTVATWNIEKSFHIEEAIKLFTSKKEFREMVDTADAALESEEFKNLERQRERLRQADILILQEMDMGVKRSGYVDAARELAKALDMNYAYGPEQLEIEPVVLGLEKVLSSDGSVDEKATEYYTADPKKYKGVFGSAVLSRYPIKKAQVFQLHNQAYDWYAKEKEKTTFLENTRRFGSETVFENEITREIKKGGRIYFRVDLDVPDLPGGTLTVIDIHLEIKCEPIGRQIQMAEILHYVGPISNPVIVAGDFNSASTDLSPTSVTRTVKRTAQNPTTWFSAAVTYLSPHALAINTSRFFSNLTKNYDDPTAGSIPVIAPNKIKGLFDATRDFRSKKGYAFDFRGDKERSVNGNDGTLANSNQRDFKGFKTTFSVKRPLTPWIGKFRLDWMFVKSFLRDPEDKEGPYRFAPHFAETLEELNSSLKAPISDHHPNVVDLPFREPKL